MRAVTSPTAVSGSMTVQPEMRFPRVSPGSKKSDRLASTVDRCEIPPFVPIAKHTGVGQIPCTRGPTVLPADNMIDLVRKSSAIYMHQTGFANVDARARPRDSTRRRPHHEPLARICRALGHPEDVFQIHEAIQFRLLLGRQTALFFPCCGVGGSATRSTAMMGCTTGAKDGRARNGSR